jgi:hypothetical protein
MVFAGIILYRVSNQPHSGGYETVPFCSILAGENGTAAKAAGAI